MNPLKGRALSVMSMLAMMETDVSMPTPFKVTRSEFTVEVDTEKSLKQAVDAMSAAEDKRRRKAAKRLKSSGINTI